MKNNKGFSLVELIIVIAIMAILVGVMAPQLIRYIEKAKVSNDTQVADAVHTAMVTAMMDPSVIANDSANIPAAGAGGVIAPTNTAGTFWGEVGLTLKAASVGDVTSSLKSAGAGTISYQMDTTGNVCSIILPGTDSTGNKAGSPNIIVY